MASNETRIVLVAFYFYSAACLILAGTFMVVFLGRNAMLPGSDPMPSVPFYSSAGGTLIGIALILAAAIRGRQTGRFQSAGTLALAGAGLVFATLLVSFAWASFLMDDAQWDALRDRRPLLTGAVLLPVLTYGVLFFVGHIVAPKETSPPHAD